MIRRVLLPVELGGHDPAAVPALIELLDRRCGADGVGEVDASELSSVWPFPVDLAADPAAYHDLLVHLDDARFALVPDPRVGDPHAAGRLTMYREIEPDSLDADALFRLESLRMAWRIIVADGLVTEAEVWRLEDRIEVEGRVPDAATRRVFHTHRWHRMRPDHGLLPDSGQAFAPTFDPATAPLADRHALLRLLVSVAVSGGHVGPQQIDALHAAATRLHIDLGSADTLVDRMTRQPLVWPGAEPQPEPEQPSAIDLTIPTTAGEPHPVEAGPVVETDPRAQPEPPRIPTDHKPVPARRLEAPPVIDLTEAVRATESPVAWTPAHASIRDAVESLDGGEPARADSARRPGSGLGRRFRGR